MKKVGFAIAMALIVMVGLAVTLRADRPVPWKTNEVTGVVMLPTPDYDYYAPKMVRVSDGMGGWYTKSIHVFRNYSKSCVERVNTQYAEETEDYPFFDGSKFIDRPLLPANVDAYDAAMETFENCIHDGDQEQQKRISAYETAVSEPTPTPKPIVKTGYGENSEGRTCYEWIKHWSHDWVSREWDCTPTPTPSP